MNQCEIWAFKGEPLRESDWIKNGHKSLADYIDSLIAGHDGHQRTGCRVCRDNEKLTYCTFGSLDDMQVRFIAKSKNDLPITDIEGVLIYNKN